MNRIKGILYAAVSSSTFGLAPFFSITLLMIGFSAFEVLSYRWGVASIVLTVLGLFSGCKFRLSVKDFKVVFGLSLLRAITSFSLIIAYQNIASGVASTIHFMYPLVVALAMMFFFREKKSLWATAIRIYSVSYLISELNIFASSFFTALNNGFVSAAISFLRMFLFQIIMILLLPVIIGINGIWIAVTAAESLALVVSVVFVIINRKKYGYMI